MLYPPAQLLTVVNEILLGPLQTFHPPLEGPIVEETKTTPAMMNEHH